MSAITDAGGAGEIEETLTDREIRALTERLVALDRDASGLFTVLSEEGTEYTVDIPDGSACACLGALTNRLGWLSGGTARLISSASSSW